MIARNTANGALSGGFIAKLQDRTEAPRIVFRFQTDSTTDLNEDLDDAETIIDVDDNSVFEDDDIIKIDDEMMLVVDADHAANQIEVTRGYGLSIAATHDNNEDIYIMAEYDVLNVSDISIDPDFGASEAVVTVSNADLSWNIFTSDLTNHGKEASIELKFDGLAENMYVFRGAVDHVEYSSLNMTCSIYLYERLRKFLDQEISPETGALDIANVFTSPMDFIWAILVTEGGLDSEASQANVDIDYTKWNDLKTKLTAQNANLGARIPRFHTYRTAIQALLYLWNCWAFTTNEGKIGFDYGENDAGGGDDTWTQAHIVRSVDGSDIEGHRWYTDLSGIVNWQNTSWGYDSDTGKWGGNDINQEATSQTDFGVFAIAELNTWVWHDDSASGGGGSDWIEAIHSDPKVFSEVVTWLYGARVEIGDVIDLTDADAGFTNKLMKIMKILSFNLTDFTITVLLRA